MLTSELPDKVRWLKEPEAAEEGDRERVEATVRAIIDAVRREGLEGVRRYSRELDGWDPAEFRVDRSTIDAAYREVGESGVAQIRTVHEHVRDFAQVQLKALQEVESTPHPGIRLGHRLIPIRSVGCYVPGGQYPLIASVHMQVTTARVAGVERIVICAPPRQGQGIWPATLVAMDVCGADEIYCLGGVQALAAMAFGAGDMRAVDMLTGPGNAFVAEAKRQLFGVVGIDLPAGPTEILIVADASADPEMVACDLLGQAEHGPTSPAHLITDSPALADAVGEAIQDQLESLPTRAIAAEAWRRRGAIAIAEGPEQMLEYSDRFAPEHLQIMTRDPAWFHQRARNYGSIFLGEESTVAYSDKAVGTNHTLPTGGAARYTGGLWVGKFIKVVSYQELTREGSNFIAPIAGAIATMEGMHAHAATCERRLQKYKES
ncbi:MAG TPA: histidinol dehydrogenase [Candidatus Nitrosotalea sp.]|nr:histidinol dehydrogenase [Candidatus Nitrosotalea sp.]